MSAASSTGPSVHDPPANFAIVHPQLYRSSAFAAQHLPFINALKLRTCISLGPELPSRTITQWAEQQGVKLVHLGAQRNLLLEIKDWKPVQEELIKDALEFVLNKDNNPCIVMDHSGVYETGIFVACLRRLESWSLNAVLAEVCFDFRDNRDPLTIRLQYASIAGSKVRAVNEQFIELFDTDLVNVPPRDLRTDWFADGSET
ncbi:hypothetical protein OIV83_003251 [Microbotryomycetes sp. JL201]|nr:hypothetical protein OIV83_003251 [Microbotryomycetes sp. JL201]